MPRTVRVVFGLPILFTTVTKTWRAFMSAYQHGQPSLRAVFFRLQVVLHEQDCIQIKILGQWPVFELQSTKNIFEDSLKNIRKTHHLNFTCRVSRFTFHVFTCHVSRVAPSSSFCSLSFLPNGNHTRLQNLPVAANCEYLQKFLSLYPFLHRGQKPWTDLTMAVPVSDHAWQQTMRKASR